MPRLRVQRMLTINDHATIWQAVHAVRDMAQTHEQAVGGGAPYFDRLDASIRSEPVIFEAMGLLVRHHWNRRMGIIVSGGFGMDYERWARSQAPELRPVLALRGGLRHRALPEWAETSQYRFRMQGIHSFVMLDDSLYAGRTLEWVRTLVLMSGREFAGAVVAYDGSKERLRNVHSLFRYFNES